MIGLVILLLHVLVSPFKTQAQLSAEVVLLRHQLNVLRQRVRVTDPPTAEWIARQITDAFPWDEAPDYMVQDRDRCYGHTVTK